MEGISRNYAFTESGNKETFAYREVILEGSWANSGVQEIEQGQFRCKKGVLGLLFSICLEQCFSQNRLV